MVIKVHDWVVEELQKEYPLTNRYEATRSAWKIRPRSIEEYPYVFSVTDGIVKEVYKVHSWTKSAKAEGRYEFNGEIAKEIRDRFVDKRIPERYMKKGMASPVLFSKN